jgi:hypothetical protein
MADTEKGRQTPLEPAPEAYVGDVLPGGRGTEEHGVDWSPSEGYEDGTDEYKGEALRIQYEEEPPEVEPVPVRVVSEYPREEAHWRVTRTALSAGQTAALVGRQESRTMVVVKVVSGDCYIGDQLNNASTYTGYPLAAGDSFTTDAVTAIYGFSAAGADIAVLQSFRVER